MTAYYNENDINAAAWLRELIKQGLITDGEVDERSIEDVLPADLAGFDRCHFFAGLGVWDFALDLAGWPDDRPVWTGSCPCQSFSSAGKGAGFDDERHLWPAFFHLISQCRPDVIFGEQVASKLGSSWLDLVHSDLEGEDYTVGAADIPVAGFGAPHIRQRYFWVADSGLYEPRRKRGDDEEAARLSSGERPEHGAAIPGRNGATGSLGQNAERLGRRGRDHGDTTGNNGEIQTQGLRSTGGLVNSELRRSEQRDASERSIQVADERREPGELVQPISAGLQGHSGYEYDGNEPGRLDPSPERPATAPSFTNGFWSDVEWVYCNDPSGPKWRPVKSGIFPLADGTPGRVAILRGIGNAISPWVAKAFIEAVMEETCSR